MKKSIITRCIAAAAISASALSLGAGVASASDYDNADSIEISHETATPGMTVEIIVRGFKANSDVTLVMQSDAVTLGTFKADAVGVVRAEVDLPKDAKLGKNTIEATGTAPDGSAIKVSTEITIAESLPETGSDIGMLLIIGGAAAALGTGVVVARRRAAL
jgi:LPXTG-motif cell wall-anchored protein